VSQVVSRIVRRNPTRLRIAITFPVSLGAPGGGSNDCFQLARHLVRAGAEVVLLPVPSIGPSRFPRLPPGERYDGRDQAERLRAEGVEVIGVPRNPAIYLLDGLPVRRAVGRLLAEREIDVCLGWGHEARFLEKLLRKHGVLFAMNAAGSYGPVFRPPGGPSPPIYRLRNRFFLAHPLRRAEIVFARSEFTRGEIVSLVGVAPERIRVVYCGVDPVFATVERAPSPAGAPDAQSVPGVSRLLYFGPLTEAKGIFDALEALGRLAAAGRDGWTLGIAGWGDEERVREAAREHGILERIELLGRLDRLGLCAELGRAQLAVLPSITESFGLANAEAQAAGTPVVAYDVAAVPEVVEKGVSGWLVPLGSIDGLAAAIAEAMDDPARTRRAGLAGRERVTRLFTWEKTAAATLEGLSAALAGREAARA